MEGMKESDAEEDRPPSPSEVLQQISEEAVRVADAGRPPQAHRRVQSDVVGSETVQGRGGHGRSNSFQKLKTSVQKAFQKGRNKEVINVTSFNPEVLVNQKRQWYRTHNQKLDLSIYKEPTSLFEHFVIVGLPPDADLKAVEDVFAKRKIWEANMRKAEVSDIKMLKYLGPAYPMLEPQILFGYPPAKTLAVHPNELTAFCFPEGVQARLMEKTPSMSDLNAAIHGQEHRGRDDLSFIFSLKGADNVTLYGVCLHVEEIVQRSPGIIRGSLSRCSGGFSRFLVSAPRCYCVLTRVPFFELHYELLNSVVTQERLNRITQFVSQMNIIDYVPSPLGEQDSINGNGDSPIRKHPTDWTAFAIPVDSAGALTAAAAGIISDEEVRSLSSRLRESETPETNFAGEPSNIDQAIETDKESRKVEQQFGDNASETLGTDCDECEEVCGSYVNGHTSPDTKISFGESRESSESLFSSVRSIGSEDEDDEVSSLFDKNAGDDTMMIWAKENNNELLQIVCCYHAVPLPPYGGQIVFQPLEHLQAITYTRPLISSFGVYGIPPDINLQDTIGSAEVNVRLAAAEEAFSLSLWTTATVCRVLSLDSILAIFAGVLLEKQVVVVCPNMGVLSAVVLSLVSMIHPFEWQSLLLPVLPRKLLEFLDAPVPFIVGIQNKPADLKMKTANLIYVDVIKDKVTICYMPRLPRYKELVLELLPIHSKLSCENSVAKRHPVYKCNEVQAEASGQFLNVMRRYLESLCSDLRSHTITSVQSNSEKVALLFKDSFIDSFTVKDRPFVKLLVDTQLFSVLSDSRLSSYEHE